MEGIPTEQIAEYRRQCINELAYLYEVLAVPCPRTEAEREHYVAMMSDEGIIYHIQHGDLPRSVMERILYYDFMTPGDVLKSQNMS